MEGSGNEEPNLEPIIASASQYDLSHILLDLCRHSKTAAEIARSHLFQTSTPFAIATAAPIAVPDPTTTPAVSSVVSTSKRAPTVPTVSPAVSTSNRPNEEASKKQPTVLHSILKKRKHDTGFHSSPREVSWSPSQPDDASTSLGRVASPLPPSVVFSSVTSNSISTSKASSSSSSNSSNSESSNSKSSNSKTSNSTTSSSNSNSSSSKSKRRNKSKSTNNSTSPTPEENADSPKAKKRKPPAPTSTRCRNCGSDYTNTPQYSPSSKEPATTKSSSASENELGDAICVHHTGKFQSDLPFLLL
jgi:hypothetical protein